MSYCRCRGDYEVGYGRPPIAHQFKPGQSGTQRDEQESQRFFRTSARRSKRLLVDK